MASIHRKANSPNWYCAYYLPDGRRTLRSTATGNRRKALSICLEYDKASRLAQDGRLSESRARAAIADIYAIANQEALPTETVKEYLESWLIKKTLEIAESSSSEYRKAVDNLVRHLGAKANKPIDSVGIRDISSFRAKLAKRVAGATVNKNLKILRGAWTEAVRMGLISDNVFARVGRVKQDESKRRAFTLAELQDLLNACNDEWRGMVMVGLYTGQRLADIAALTWRQVDLETDTVTFLTRKTSRRMNIPLAGPLKKYFLGIPSADDPDAPVFSSSYHTLTVRGRTNTLSRQFSEILIDAKLISRPKAHESTGKGRDQRRKLTELSFHCLRHTATSLLKNAGVSDVVAREIIGHDSEAVSRSYTHIEEDTLREAVRKLPDVT